MKKLELRAREIALNVVREKFLTDSHSSKWVDFVEQALLSFAKEVIEELKTENEYLKRNSKATYDLCAELKAENEELKKFNKNLACEK